MAFKYDFKSDENEFSWPEVAAICTSLGGNSETLSYQYNDKEKLVCGEFELDISFGEYNLISGCAKYISVHDDFEYFLNNDSIGPLRFTCIVLKPTTNQLIITRTDSFFAHSFSAVNVPISIGQYFFIFIQEREKYHLSYQIGIHPHNSDLTVMCFAIDDERHIWRSDEYSISSLN